MTIAAGRGGMGGGLVPGIYPEPTAMRPTLVGDRWAVVAGHPLVSAVAAEIFHAGGNAVDAGVAAGIASNVVQVDMANFGGIAPILVRPPGSPECFSVAGVGRWSTTASRAAVVERHGGAMPLGGVPSIVPGAPAAWLAALTRFGSMSLAEVAAPAIALASDGFMVDRALATSLALMAPRFTQWPTSAAIYQPNGEPFVAGGRLRQPALARTLQTLVAAETSATGTREQRIRAAHDAFYRGDIADRLVAWVRDHGGYLTVEDLADFDAEIEVAPSIQVLGWQFFATPSWSQGPVALQILGILGRTRGGWHELVEAITQAFNDREDHYAAPDRMALDVMSLLSDEYLDQCAAKIDKRAAAGRPGNPAGSVMTSTTAVVTMQADGSAFATSPSDTLDGAPIEPELGIMCSPRGVQSRLDPDHPNRLEPGARPVVTPAAMIGIAANDSWALACPGGDVIVQAMAQVIWRVLNDELDPQEAVEYPRIAAFNAPSAFHPHPTADRLVYAESRIPQDERDALRDAEHDVQDWPPFEFDAGSVQMIVRTCNAAGEPWLQAAADPRRSAYAIAR